MPCWKEKTTKELPVAITGNWQVSLPSEVRDALGIHPGDMVAFQVEKGIVTLVRVGDGPSRMRRSADDVRHESLEKITRQGFEPPPVTI
jgi:AbrB family looped-hinge helix DNA binding protein